MQVYGRLALEDNSEVGEVVLGKCSISCICTPVPSSSQPKKQTHSLQWVLLGEDLVSSPSTCEVGVAGSIPGRTDCERAWIGPGIPLHNLSDQP